MDSNMVLLLILLAGTQNGCALTVTIYTSIHSITVRGFFQ
jgi:hypothetical protein